MGRRFLFFIGFIFLFSTLFSGSVFAQTPTVEGLLTPIPTVEPTARPVPELQRFDLTQNIEETVGPLEKLLEGQKLGPALPFNPLKYAIRGAVEAGVPPNTIVLLLLLPFIAAFIAAARHVGGVRGFGIFLPASLSVAFVAIGPVLGVGLFVLIVTISTVVRMLLREFKVKLQYLPKMALILWAVVFGVLGLLFLAPFIRQANITSVSIFPVLILVLLAEDFSKIQVGKSARTAISLGTETVVLSLLSYIFLTMEALQQFALLNPEILMIGVLVFDLALGKYIGLRFTEYWRYRKLIRE